MPHRSGDELEETLTSDTRDLSTSSIPAPPRRSVKYLALSAGTDLLTTMVAFGTGLLVARFLGAHDRGVYTLVTTSGMLIAYAVGMGLFESLLSGNLRPSRAHLRTAVTLGTIGAVVMLLFAGSSQNPHFAVYAAFPVLWGVMQISLARAALEQRWSWVYLRALPSAIQITSTVALWLSGHLTVAAAMVAMLMGQAATFGIDRVLNGRFASRPGLRMRGVVWHGIPHHLLNLPRMANYRGPILVLGMLSSPTDVGLFAVASAVGSLVPALTWSVTQNLLVLTARGSGDADRTRKSLTVIGYVSSIGGAILFVFIGEDVLTWLYGPTFGGTWHALVLVLAAQGLWMHSSLLQVIYRTAGLSHWAAAIEVIGIATLLVVMFFTTTHGYMSAAYGTAATCVVTLCLSLAIHKLNPRRFGENRVRT